MTQETDLLRRAAEYARDAHALEDHRLLYALADQMERVRALVEEQAEDEGLWFEAQTAPEAYLQQALRELHAAVEADK